MKISNLYARIEKPTLIFRKIFWRQNFSFIMYFFDFYHLFSGKEVFFFWGLPSIILKKNFQRVLILKFVDKFFATFVENLQQLSYIWWRDFWKWAFFHFPWQLLCLLDDHKSKKKWKIIRNYYYIQFLPPNFFSENHFWPLKIDIKNSLICIFCDFDHF